MDCKSAFQMELNLDNCMTNRAPQGAGQKNHYEIRLNPTWKKTD